jgi:hypothetical protein
VSATPKRQRKPAPNRQRPEPAQKRKPLPPVGTLADEENERWRKFLKLPEPKPARRRITINSPFARRAPVFRIEISWP